MSVERAVLETAKVFTNPLTPEQIEKLFFTVRERCMEHPKWREPDPEFRLTCLVRGLKHAYDFVKEFGEERFEEALRELRKKPPEWFNRPVRRD